MRSNIVWAALAIGVVSLMTVENGFATQPASSYSFPNLTAGLRQVSSSYYVDDFAFSVLNVSGGTETVRATLVADDPNFQFVDCNSQGTYTYGTWSLADVTGYAPNVLNLAVLASGAEFTGELDITSLGTGNFYVFEPADFTVANSVGETIPCDAYYSAWQNSSWAVPWFYDSTAQVLVSPYANVWHNDKFWYKGWNSEIAITNNSSQTVNYSVWYIKGGSPSPSVTSLNPSTCTQSSSLNQLATPTVGSGATWLANLKDDILQVSSTEVLTEDGFFYAYQSPLVAGTSPTHNIYPNSSGSHSNCGNICQMTTQCH